MPRIKYLACKHCGSEYLVQRQGNTIGLEPFVEEQYEISRQIADVEKSQGEGCSNVFFWIFLVAILFFCIIGFLGRTFFNNDNTALIVGWAISIFVLVAASGVLLRRLNSQRAERLDLEAKQQELYKQRGDENQAFGKTDNI